jgi:hypothetical protein
MIEEDGLIRDLYHDYDSVIAANFSGRNLLKIRKNVKFQILLQ